MEFKWKDVEVRIGDTKLGPEAATFTAACSPDLVGSRVFTSSQIECEFREAWPAMAEALRALKKHTDEQREQCLRDERDESLPIGKRVEALIMLSSGLENAVSAPFLLPRSIGRIGRQLYVSSDLWADLAQKGIVKSRPTEASE